MNQEDPPKGAHTAPKSIPSSGQAVAGDELGETFLVLPPPGQLPPLPQLGLRGADDDDLVVSGVLGSGGMAKVESAHQRSLEREVALKRAREGASPGTLSALVREARLTGALEHPNIVPVHGLGLDELGKPVLVMKRIDGVSWATLLEEPDHNAWPELLARHGDRLAVHVEILQRVCDALELAHSRGVIHRDIKPANVMIGSFGEVYLADWGIATTPSALSEAERAPGQLVGTPAYMAPEMVDGRADLVDERTDVYLLGATLHKVLTGRAPHPGKVFQALDSARASKVPEYGPGVPPDLSALCRRALSRDKEDRPKTVREVRTALAEHLRNRHAHALIDAAENRLVKIRSAPQRLVEYSILRELLEARFGFLEALRSLPDSTVAQAGLGECLRLLAKREIALKNPIAAQAYVDELEQADPTIGEEIEALRQEVLREEKLRAELGQEDPAPSALSRWRLTLVMSAAGLLIAAMLVLRSPMGIKVPWYEALATDLCTLALVPIAAIIIGKRVFVNRMARRFFAMLVCALTGNLAGDICNAIRGWDPVASAIHGHLILGTSLAVAAVNGGRLLWAASAVMAAGAAIDVAFPAAHLLSMATTTATGALLLSLSAYYQLREAKSPERG